MHLFLQGCCIASFLKQTSRSSLVLSYTVLVCKAIKAFQLLMILMKQTVQLKYKG